MARDVLITGGTGSVGRSIVREFANNGDNVIFQYNSNEEVAGELANIAGVKSWKADFSDESVDFPATSFDIIVNSVGINIVETFTEGVSDEVWETTLQVNITTPFQIIRKYIPQMVENGGGRIINIGSIYSLRGVANNSAYNVSKHALTGLTKSIAKEYASDGITCNEICPAAVESDLMNRIAARKAEEEDLTKEEYLNQVREANPKGRMALPADVASAALFLASDEAEFINGQSVVVDGGQIC